MRFVRTSSPWLPLLLLPPTLLGCAKVGCLTGAEDCIVPSPCEGLAFTCDGGATDVHVIAPGDPILEGFDVLASPGDFVLENDQVRAVIDALDHPHYIAPTGGALIDLSTHGEENDSLRHVFQAVGLLPGESIAYDSAEILEDDGIKAVQFKGTLVGFPEVVVATRYEIRPCEPGIRVRTEIVNGTPDPQSWFLTDAFYYGGRETIPFTPGPGAGFDHPSFGLSDIGTAFRDVPYLVAAAHVPPAATYAAVSCLDRTLSGFHAEEISAVGVGPDVVMPRDYLVYERFIAAAPGGSVSAGGDIALEVRKQLWDEPWVELSGAVSAPGGEIGETLRASVLVSEGTPDTPVEERTPWTQALPDETGRFTARVPTDRDYVLEVEAFGRAAGSTSLHVGTTPTSAATIQAPPVGEVSIYAKVDNRTEHVLVFVVPSDDATDLATRGDMYGHFGECAPLLGHPHGSSPACNRVLVDGYTTVAIPPGTYDFYAVAGPFTTLGAQRGVVVDDATGQSVVLELETLDVQPEGTLSADFHVHGGASFDSSLADYDRVRAFLAARIDVVASTEHDVVSDYGDAMEDLDAADDMVLIAGTESTGHILFNFRDDYGFPEVIGHWNFWPVPYDPEGPYRGSAWDELAEPGLLMTRQRDAGWDDVDGVAQLNHPIGGSQFGRDYSWGTAAGFDLTRPLQTSYDGTGQSLFFHTPDGADFPNSAYDVQEVMNGTNNLAFLGYRAFWWYLLDQGIVRGGTANSDSHSLTENVLGTPRNLVWADTSVDDFDLAVFDAAVREGRILGTNGPVIEATVTAGDGSEHTPSTESFDPGSGATLTLVVRAAPWVPVDEVRIVVNGEVVQVITDGLSTPTDPLGTEGVDRLAVDIPLDPLLPGSGDAWVVVEAGTPLEPNEDLNCDGIPDTGDNNRDGAIDWRDVEDLTEDPGEDCFSTVGPLTDPAPPDRGTPGWFFATVTPDGYPLAFTNPLLLDRDGGGFDGASR